MKPAAFGYHAPSTAQEAVSLLAELGEDAKIIAGGQSLVPMLALRLAVVEHLVDLRRLAGLRGIEQRDGSAWIGAATTQAAIEQSAKIASAVPLLARATPLIGHFQIRNRGTLGGSMAHADPAAEYPAVALALGAQVQTLSPRGGRAIAADGFFTGMWSTRLEADELLTGISFPLWNGRCGFAIEEFAARRGDFAIAGAAVAVELDAGQRISRCGIGLFGLGPTPVRALATEAALAGSAGDGVAAGEIGQSAVSDLPAVPSDLHASASYRKRVGAAMVTAAWQRAIGEALSA